MIDIVKRLRAIDHMNVDDCFLQSHLYAQAADEIERLRKLLEEAYHDLAAYVSAEHPYREDYPDEMRRYKRDMDLADRIMDALND